jgi:hypothetical protein
MSKSPPTSWSRVLLGVKFPSDLRFKSALTVVWLSFVMVGSPSRVRRPASPIGARHFLHPHYTQNLASVHLLFTSLRQFATS